MRFDEELGALLCGDPVRRTALEAVRSLALPDGWIGAGFVRDAVWDHLHGRRPAPPAHDVDVVWFDAARTAPEVDLALEARLRKLVPSIHWSVKNQARMHVHNGDGAYRDVADAMAHWPETATATAVRLTHDGRLEVNAPFGLTDLFALVLRPTPPFEVHKRAVFDRRVAEKRWLARYPSLRAAPSP